MLPTRHASKVQALLPQTYNKERPPGSLGGSKSLCRCIHSVPFLLSSLTPQDADFTALLSAVYFLREEWVNWYLPFIWSRWHQSQTKSPGALEVNSLGEKKKKSPANCSQVQDTFSAMMLISQSITGFAKWFSIPCLICWSHSTRKQVSLFPPYSWERRDHGNSRPLQKSHEEQKEEPTPGLPSPLHCCHRESGKMTAPWCNTAHAPFKLG